MAKSDWTGFILRAVGGSALLVLGAVGAAIGHPGEIVVEIRRVSSDGVGESVGRLYLEDRKYGLLIVPELHGLEPGPHALHLHESPSCASHESAAAGGAGGHYDPKKTRRHLGPYGEGHLGDLPNLIVEADGTARIPVLAPRLRQRDIKPGALIIHEGPDRYQDEPAPALAPDARSPSESRVSTTGAPGGMDHSMHAGHAGHAGHSMGAASPTGGIRMYCGTID